MPTDDDTLIPLAQAAMRLEITRAVAYRRLRLGRLHATFVKNKLMVRTSEVERYREEAIAHSPQGRHRGRKPKKPTE